MAGMLGNALSVRLQTPTGLICALHERGECRELFFEDAGAAAEFARRKGLAFETVEQPRDVRAEDYLHGVSALTEVEHSVVL